MARSIRFAVCLTTVLCAGAAFAQDPSGQTDASTSQAAASTPVAYVYVGNTIDQDNLENNLYGFSAAANGKLTALPGSPFAINPAYVLEGNGKFLFDVNYNTLSSDTEVFDTFSVAHHGIPELVDKATAPPGDYQVDAFLDHTGTHLYNLVFGGPDHTKIYFQVFSINQTTGKLSYSDLSELGETSKVDIAEFGISFLGNNEYAYSPSFALASCSLLGFRHRSDGAMQPVNIGTLEPKPKDSGHFFCPAVVAGDATDHVALLLEEYASVDAYQHGHPYAPPVIATYTAGSNGELTTTNTYEDLKTVTENIAFGFGGFSISPSGKFLAVSRSQAGLEIFHFDGAKPVTEFKTLLTHEAVYGVSWDNNNHLYVTGANTAGRGSLYVYTITPAGITEAPGSPYAIPQPFGIVVQPG